MTVVAILTTVVIAVIAIAAMDPAIVIAVDAVCAVSKRDIIGERNRKS